MTVFLWFLTGGIILGIMGLIFFSRRKKTHSVGIILSLCLSIACAVMFVVDISVEPVKYIDSQQSTQNAVVSEVDTSTTFEDIYREFKRNELNAKDLYNGKRYELTAEINSISSSGLFNLTGGATLTMEKQVDNTIVFFTAEFEKEQEKVLKELSVGDTITFTGTCYGGNFTDCEID